MQSPYVIIIFYKYTPISDPVTFAELLRKLGLELELTGRILVASEGINGTVEGTAEHIEEFEACLHAQDGSAETFADFHDVWFKSSPGTGSAFKGLKVKVRNEIVTLGLGEEDVDPNTTTGVHITPQTLKEWIENGEEFEIVDMRNEYEYKVGHFRNSINPGLENFRDLPGALPKLEHLKKKKVLTVCTYGVRCEKASGYLVDQGFEEVYQLNGGIGTYMKQYPGEDFLGSLYVFDGRILEQEAPEYEVVGVCETCGASTEHFTNCAFDSCHKKMLVCETCVVKNPGVYCSGICNESHIAWKTLKK
jgi:UPF0176 protein